MQHCDCMSSIASVCPFDVGGSGLHVGNIESYLHGQLAKQLRFLQPKRHSPTMRETWGHFEELEVGCGKVVCWSTKAAISPKSAKIEEKLLCRAYRNSPTLERHHTRPPMASSSQDWGFATPTQNSNRYYLTNG